MSNPATQIRMLIADENAVVREAMKLLLEAYDDLEIVGMASNGRDAIDLAVSLAPDVVIMDFQMPLIDGPHATREIRVKNACYEIDHLVWSPGNWRRRKSGSGRRG